MQGVPQFIVASKKPNAHEDGGNQRSDEQDIDGVPLSQGNYSRGHEGDSP